ncbi:hypothetical protein BU16DRAFT_187037 [Lophium mytilinum]|uniref:Uncharacterized protein n=1 Tax=Lophium mytilinum TaxID=390894 RepID=A0A6A6R995_9PEZI|nr:hypothetical protein BU16DRAFT_187037 [Lophium mytilinum]
MAGLSAGVVFNIPVAQSPYGQAIPPGYKIEDYPRNGPSRNFPCRVGNISVSSSLEEGKLVPLEDESSAFLNATGLSFVEGFDEECVKYASCKMVETAQGPNSRHWHSKSYPKGSKHRPPKGTEGAGFWEYSGCQVQENITALLKPEDYSPGPWNDWHGNKEANEWEDFM